MKKDNFLCILVPSVIFTTLYTFLAIAEPGAGWADSFLAQFEFGELMGLALSVAFVGFLIMGVILAVLLFISFLASRDASDELIETVSCFSTIACVVYFLAAACGFISFGG